MDFDSWLLLAQISKPAFAKLVGKPPSTVYKWPSSAESFAILEAITGGAVTPADYAPDVSAMRDHPEAIAARARVQAALAVQQSDQSPNGVST